MSTDMEILPPEKLDGGMIKKAEKLDERIREGAKSVAKSFVQLAGDLYLMKQEGLWEFLVDKDGKKIFRRYEAYAKDAMGDMGRSKVYELLAIAELEKGSKPIARETIKELGVKKAAALVQLPEGKRTQAVIKDALAAESVAEVKDQVRVILNEDLPASERKEAGATLVLQLPIRTLARFEKLVERGIWMEGIRDGDKTLTMKQKLFHAMIVVFEEQKAAELEEADEYRKKSEALAKENAEAGKAAAEAKKAAAKTERANKKKSAPPKSKAKRGKTPKRKLVSVESA